MLGFYRSSGTALLITSYAGKTLKSLLEAGKLSRMNPRDRIRMARQLAEAVDNINWLGVSHNDISSNNVCIKDTGSGYEMCVIDLGLATTNGMRVVLAGDWDPEYKGWYAPELFKRGVELVSGAADAYAVGQLVSKILDTANLDHDINQWI